LSVINIIKHGFSKKIKLALSEIIETVKQEDKELAVEL